MSEKITSIDARVSTRTLERAAWRINQTKRPEAARAIERELQRREWRKAA